nr:PREDICTED: L-type lectin-domain containing receptor kinase IX.1-like isoform X1 [Daucus carota subsp. sativus]
MNLHQFQKMNSSMVSSHLRAGSTTISSILIRSLIFLSTIQFAATLHFNFTNFNRTNDDQIKYERDAFTANDVIHLTNAVVGQSAQSSIGRVTYRQPLHLWDKASRNLTDFTTRFTFVIDSRNDTSYGDGMAFFLVPNGTGVPALATSGGTFGLTNDSQPTNTTANKFVAVEFDVYGNDWDPGESLDPDLTIPPGEKPEHVGVDINSVESEETELWKYGSSSVINGWTNEAQISYASSSKNLSVSFRTLNYKDSPQSFYFVVDLRDHLPDWVSVGFSASTGAAISYNTINSWEFSSTLESHAEAPSPSHPLPPVPPPSQTGPVPQVPKHIKTNNKRMGLVIGLAVGVFLLVCSGAIYRILKKKKEKQEYENNICFEDDFMDDEFEKGTGPKKFSYSALAMATSSFAPHGKLGEGGFGEVYKGFLSELNLDVAVKRVSRNSRQGIKEYASEVRIISRLRHKNLVQLIGWCHERNNLLLVYEYMQNGSLDSHLFKGKSLLSWSTRYKIAQGLASVLLYLHEEWEQCVVHRDIKSSNVMLDSSFNTKLGDFGLARFVDHERGAQTTMVAGTRGYMAPECFFTGQASRMSDVFSFGVVALEIACGRKPIDIKLEESRIELVKWVWELHGREQILEAADPKLSGDYDESQMKRLMMVGLWCAHPDWPIRPSIKEAIQILNFDAPLPVLPPQMPVATYSIPSNLCSENRATTQRSQTHSSGSSNGTDSSVSATAARLNNTR